VQKARLRVSLSCRALCLLFPAIICFGADDGTGLARYFAEEVDRRLDIPDAEQRNYGDLLSTLLEESLCSPVCGPSRLLKNYLRRAARPFRRNRELCKRVRARLRKIP
jgi:hypothetical protein